jgi:long-chain acyl-CoA synthetase
MLAQLLGNAFPFARRRGPARVDHLQSLLDQGWSVLIYPEGKLTVCGPMQPFKGGIGLVAVDTRRPVVPVRVDVLRRGPWEGGGRLSRGQVEVRFGAPMRFAADDDPGEATARLEASVRAL